MEISSPVLAKERRIFVPASDNLSEPKNEYGSMERRVEILRTIEARLFLAGATKRSLKNLMPLIVELSGLDQDHKEEVDD